MKDWSTRLGVTTYSRCQEILFLTLLCPSLQLLCTILLIFSLPLHLLTCPHSSFIPSALILFTFSTLLIYALSCFSVFVVFPTCSTLSLLICTYLCLSSLLIATPFSLLPLPAPCSLLSYPPSPYSLPCNFAPAPLLLIRLSYLSGFFPLLTCTYLHFGRVIEPAVGHRIPPKSEVRVVNKMTVMTCKFRNNIERIYTEKNVLEWEIAWKWLAKHKARNGGHRIVVPISYTVYTRWQVFRDHNRPNFVSYCSEDETQPQRNVMNFCCNARYG